ncbi:MAG: glycosyltransferase, partial [Anaerolineaceae bacterium]|nr:glycosyltransferase [Anaerolineaceae bacterium]
DLYVSPSHSDGSSISLLEAMATGRSVLVSDIPSNREWVMDGVNGRLFTDGSEADLTTKLVEMVTDPKRTDYGKQAHLVATERADWVQNFRKCLLAYQLAMV